MDNDFVCTIAMMALHAHGPTSAHLEAFMEDVTEGFDKVLEDAQARHPDVQVMDMADSDSPFDEDDDDETFSPDHGG